MIEKKRATDRASKMAVVLASREGREAFGRKKTKLDPFASTTNKVCEGSCSLDFVI